MRTEPYRLFFPLGLVLSWAGVGHWLLLGLGVIDEYRSIFHAMTQIQGFLICFATGFLFTMLPRRTSSPPPSSATIAVCLICPVGTTVAAWQERWVIAQVFFLVLALLLLFFVARRLDPSAVARRAPNSFLWIPSALFLGLVGTVLTAVGAAMAESHWFLHEIGRGLVLQGMFLCLVLGAGGLVIPLMTRGESAPDASSGARDRWSRVLQVAAIVLVVASFPIENLVSLRLGLGLRGGTALILSLAVAKIGRPPNRPGLGRWLIWLGAWCVPLGYCVAALVPQYVRGALHITFIGGFALLALSVSSQVVLGHGGYERVKNGRPWLLLVVFVALLGATAARFLVDARPEQFSLWMSVAAGLFLIATSAWASLLVPLLFRRASSDGA